MDAEQPSLEDPGFCREVAVSADGKLAYAGYGGGAMAIWDIKARKVVRRIRNPGLNMGKPFCHAFSANGKFALCGSRIDRRGCGGGDNDTLTLWDLIGGVKIRTFAIQEPVISAALSPDGKLALSASFHM